MMAKPIGFVRDALTLFLKRHTQKQLNLIPEKPGAIQNMKTKGEPI